MELKELLGEELAAQVQAKIGDKKLIVNDGTFIPKDRLDQEIGKRKEAEARVKDLTDQASATAGELDKLKKAAEGNEALTKQIAELQDAGKKKDAEWSGKVKAMRIETEIRKALTAKNVEPAVQDLLVSRFDQAKITHSEDFTNFTGVTEQIAELEKAYPVLFAGQRQAGGTGHQPGGAGDPNFISREQAAKMTPSEVQQNLEKINASMEKWQ